jgi:Xaa-Pro aminopeptidase
MEIELTRTRIRNLQNDLIAQGAGGQLIAATPNLAYLTGLRPMTLERLLLLMVPAMGKPTLILPNLHQSEFDHLAELFALRVWADGQDPLPLVAENLRTWAPGKPVCLDAGVNARVALFVKERLPQTPTGHERAIHHPNPPAQEHG